MIKIPQPEWPDLSIFKDGVAHCITPTIGKDGVVRYECLSDSPEVIKKASIFVNEFSATRTGKDKSVAIELITKDLTGDETRVEDSVPSGEIGSFERSVE